jgi:transcriptional regulator with XRE-family HTH domain
LLKGGENLQQLATNIRRLRKRNRETQSDIAQLIGVSIGEVSHYEQGIRTPPIGTLERLARHYETTIDELIK